jgi:hypothetical protein
MLLCTLKEGIVALNDWICLGKWKHGLLMKNSDFRGVFGFCSGTLLRSTYKEDHVVLYRRYPQEIVKEKSAGLIRRTNAEGQSKRMLEMSDEMGCHQKFSQQQLDRTRQGRAQFAWYDSNGARLQN